MFDQDLSDVPDYRRLWMRTHVARKPGRPCDCCHEPIEVGQKYESHGYTEDGVFKHDRCHWAAYHYPSGCPKYAARDRAEAEAQMAADEKLWAPPKRPETLADLINSEMDAAKQQSRKAGA